MANKQPEAGKFSEANNIPSTSTIEGIMKNKR